MRGELSVREKEEEEIEEEDKEEDKEEEEEEETEISGSMQQKEHREYFLCLSFRG